MRSEKYRRVVASLPCIECGLEGYSQAAHSNEWSHGKGRGMKASDTALFPLCADRLGVQGCHSRFDQYKLYPREEMEAVTNRFIAQTVMQLLASGALKVA